MNRRLRLSRLLPALLSFAAAGLADAGPAPAPAPASAPAPPVDPRLGPPFRLRPRPALGSADAPLVVIEVTSFLCAHCREFHEREFPALKKRFIDTGAVRWITLNASNTAAEQDAPVFALARGALHAGHYRELAGAFFREARRPEAALFEALARPGGPGADELARWARDDTNRKAVADDFAEAAALKLEGTPAFIIRKRTPEGRFLQARIEGYESAGYLALAFEQMLQK
ncbi:MAG: DsbA family protein [Opitutaceae bacterium]|jgi:protein-disulfide isomerase|nr:DsbA family protein [Opitutaceae bacterium]